ncbi:hypothetical protein N2152v2_005516 [Parachlorella kessleri]
MFPYNVVDQRLEAGRGHEFTATRLREQQEELIELARAENRDYSLPIDQRIEDNVDLRGTHVASIHEAIPAHNVGYKLLERLGWRGGGLGRAGTGIAEPVRVDASDNGTRLGLGRQEAERQYIAAEFIERRQLEVEIQADEDEDRRRKREMEAERQRKINEDVTAETRVFYCQTCFKQYATAMEMDAHLSSYDHHHKKRLAEMRAMTVERTRKERERKERRRVEKEMAKLSEQVAKAQAAAGIGPGLDPPPPPPPDSPPSSGGGTPPPLPPPPDSAAQPSGWVSGGWEGGQGEQSMGAGTASGAARGGGGQAFVGGGWLEEPSREQGGGWATAVGPPAALQPAAGPLLSAPLLVQTASGARDGGAAVGCPASAADAAGTDAVYYDPFTLDYDDEAPPLPPGPAPPLPGAAPAHAPSQLPPLPAAAAPLPHPPGVLQLGSAAFPPPPVQPLRQPRQTAAPGAVGAAAGAPPPPQAPAAAAATATPAPPAVAGAPAAFKVAFSSGVGMAAGPHRRVGGFGLGAKKPGGAAQKGRVQPKGVFGSDSEDEEQQA